MWKSDSLPAHDRIRYGLAGTPVHRVSGRGEGETVDEAERVRSSTSRRACRGPRIAAALSRAARLG